MLSAIRKFGFRISTFRAARDSSTISRPPTSYFPEEDAGALLWEFILTKIPTPPDERAQLFVPQRHHGIDTHGAARRDVTGRHRNAEQNDGRGAKGQRIRRRNFVKQAGHPTREQKRG